MVLIQEGPTWWALERHFLAWGTNGFSQSRPRDEVAGTMEAMEVVGVQVEWIELKIRRILKAQNHQKLAQNAKIG